MVSGAAPGGDSKPSARPEESPVEQAVEHAHAELWRRFIDRDQFILDSAGLSGEVSLPTAEECLASNPNGLSWGCPNEDGAMFGGLYLTGALQRAARTRREKDSQKARKIAAGLMKLASVGERPGFIARGLSDDGSTHYAIGSNDQTSPWICGLWSYLHSDLATAAERDEIKAKVTEVLQVLADAGWRVPCDRPPFDFRGDFGRMHFEGAPRLLLFLKMLGLLTGEESWEERYHEAARQQSLNSGRTRLELCAEGMVFEQPTPQSWTGSCSVLALRQLWEIETEPALRDQYLDGLRRSADLASRSLATALKYDNTAEMGPCEDWRVMSRLWRPQNNVAEAVALAEEQLRLFAQVSPRRPYESSLVREPLFAAWVVSLCPDRQVVELLVPAIFRALRHYDYRTLHTSQFFAGELAYYQLRTDGLV